MTSCMHQVITCATTRVKSLKSSAGPPRSIRAAAASNVDPLKFSMLQNVSSSHSQEVLPESCRCPTTGCTMRLRITLSRQGPTNVRRSTPVQSEHSFTLQSCLRSASVSQPWSTRGCCTGDGSGSQYRSCAVAADTMYRARAKPARYCMRRSYGCIWAFVKPWA